MEILLITDAYIPNANSSAVLMRDLALELKRRGNNIFVLTTVENNLGVQNYSPAISVEDGINIIRVKGIKKKNVSFIQRGISEVLLPRIMYTCAMKHLRNINFDLIITYSPPITFGKLINKIKKRTKCSTYLILRDIFPQCAKDAGVLTNKILFKYFREKEKKLYKISDYIGVQSEENLKFILSENKLDKKKVEVLYNWIDINSFSNGPTVDFRKKYNLSDKLVLLYAGNMGKYQELEFLLELAKNNIDKKDVIFLIVGSGSEKKYLVSKYEHLSNVMFKDFIEPYYYPSLVKQCDIGLINLNRNLSIQNIPGKLLGYWAAQIPVMAAVNPGNDIKDIIDKSKGGLCCITGDMITYQHNFDKLYDDILFRKSMGVKGNEYLTKHFTSKISVDTIINHIKTNVK